jgi:acyl-CoA synthetase (AMP-forming)/AMP-acid ligase II
MSTPTRAQATAQITRPGSFFEIAEASVRGRRMRVFKNAPRSLRAVFESTLEHGDETYLVYDQTRQTFAEHGRSVAALANHLSRDRGVRKGDRVAIGMRNFPEWPLAFWATQVLGAIAVPLNAFWTGPEMSYAIRDSGTRILIADGERTERLAPHLDELDLEALLIARPEAPLPPGARLLDEALDAEPAGTALPEVEIQPDDDSTILYTSGTTGLPKGAIHSHRNHAHNLMNSSVGAAIAAAMRPASGPPRPRRQPVALYTFPFFHIAGLGLMYTHTFAGAKLVLMYRWDTTQALELIERERVSMVAGVPTLMRKLMEAPDIARYDLSSLGTIGSGGAPVPPDLIRSIGSHFKRRVAPTNGYGLTETTSSVVTNTGDEYLEHPDSVGRPTLTSDIRVTDDEGKPCAPRVPGEVCMYGPSVVRGYWNKPEATAEAFVDGWFSSGDIGFLDEDGLLFIVDRKKDVVIRAGENVYCAEVEAVLFEHPAIADVAIIGLPHASLGEEVAAVVELQPATAASADDLQTYARQRLAEFKVPSRVFFRDTPLPRTATGKVLKRELRDELTHA